MHFVNSSMIFFGRCGSSFWRFSSVMDDPLANLPLMMEYVCGMVLVVVSL